MAVLTFSVIVTAFFQSIVYADDFRKDKQLHEWYRYFYLHNEKSQVVNSLDYFMSSRFPASELRKSSLQGFYSQLFLAHPDESVKWLKKSRLTQVERVPLVIALAQAGMYDKSIALARDDEWGDREIQQLNSIKSPVLLSAGQLKSADMAWCWGAYKTSGHQRFLDRLFDELVVFLKGEHKGSDSALQTLIQTSIYHIEHDQQVEQYFQKRYQQLNITLQGEFDFLFSVEASDESELDCD